MQRPIDCDELFDDIEQFGIDMRALLARIRRNGGTDADYEELDFLRKELNVAVAKFNTFCSGHLGQLKKVSSIATKFGKLSNMIKKRRG